MLKNILTVLVFIAAAAGARASSVPDSLAVNELSEVVVTGTNRAVDGRYLPYSVSVVGCAELESAGSDRVLDIIEGRVPSFFVTGRNILGYGVSNGGSGQIRLRGVGGSRAGSVLMMVDGQPQFAGLYSHHIGDYYTKESVERVEVLRGPGSVLYGSNALAGVVNIVTKGVRREGFAGSLASEYGSRNTWMNTLTANWRQGKFWAMATASYDRTDGTVRRFDFEQVSAYAKAGYDFSDRWKAYADYTFVNFNARDPIYPRLSNPESTDIYKQDVIRGEASVAVSNHYDSTNGVARVYYSYGNHFIDDPRHFHSTDDRIGVLVYQNFNLWTAASATVGFDFDRYSGRIPMSGGSAHKPGSITTLERTSITEYSPYATLSQGLFNELMTVSAGLRGSFSDTFGSHAVPQGGIAFNLPKAYTVKLSAAMGYRNPSFRELYLYKPANPDLEPERMMNYEISVSKAIGSAELSLTGYYARGWDMIQTVAMHNENTGRFINKGIEATANWRVLPELRLWGSYSFLYSSLSNLTGAPRHQYFLGAEWLPIRTLSLSANLNGVSRLYVADDYRHQSYATLSIRAAWQVCRNLELTARLENITDARYTINAGYRMPGFTAFGGFKVSI